MEAFRLPKRARWLTVLVLGAWVALDGAGSILVYWGQSPLEHAVRLGRVCAGLMLVYLAADRVRGGPS